MFVKLYFFQEQPFTNITYCVDGSSFYGSFLEARWPQISCACQFSGAISRLPIDEMDAPPDKRT